MTKRQKAQLEQILNPPPANDLLAGVLSGAIALPTLYCWKFGYGFVRITHFDATTVTFENKSGKVEQKPYALFRALAKEVPEEQWHAWNKKAADMRYREKRVKQRTAEV